MTLDRLQTAVLRVAVDDYWGLWELLPELRDDTPPSGASDLAAARQVVLRMLSEGLLEVFVRDGPTGSPILVESPLAEVLLQDETSWAMREEGSTQTLVAATKTGEAAYSALGSGTNKDS